MNPPHSIAKPLHAILVAFIAIAASITPAHATVYPCDVPPAPVLCLGQKKMLSAYAGSIVDVYNPGTLATHSIGLSGDALDTAALDTFLGSQTGLVTKWYEQKNASHLTQSIGEAPSIKDLSVGNSRSIIFQGDSQYGALFSLVSEDISSLGITASAYSVILVLRPSASLFSNQNGAPLLSSGAIFDLQGSGGTVAQVYSNSLSGQRGAWQVTDGSFELTADLSPVQVNPIVLGITSDSSTGVKIWQNGEGGATGPRSVLTRTASSLYLGKLMSSVAGLKVMAAASRSSGCSPTTPA
jgi:hypothetical protein